MLSSEALVLSSVHKINELPTNHSYDLAILAQLQQAVNQSYFDEYYECLKNGRGCKPPFMVNFEDERSLLDDIDSKPLEEMKCYFGIEEQAYLEFYKSKANAYEALYREFLIRTEFLLKITRGIQELNIETVSEKEQFMTKYKERVRDLSMKNHDLEISCQKLKNELKEKESSTVLVQKKLDDRTRELQLIKGDQILLNNLELEEICQIEQTLVSSLQCFTDTKNKRIETLKFEIRKAKESVESSKKCVICHQNNIEIVIRPCNHVIMCRNCSLKVSQCPLDRSEIVSQDRIFLG